MTTITVQVAERTFAEAPRGARAAADVFAAGLLWLRAYLRHGIKPAQAAVRDYAREAAETRRVADGLRHSDPSMAAELYAIARRHEGLAD
jgi:hypothetical protein